MEPHRKEKSSGMVKLAADNGHLPAQFRYAQLLLDGKEVKNDIELAKSILREHAELGHTQSQFLLAEIIVEERPTWAGYQRALPWFEKAAQAGYPKLNMHSP